MKSHIALLSAVSALMLPAAAFASDSATDAYGGQGSVVSGVTGSSGGNGPTVLSARATRPSAPTAVAAPTATQAVPGGSLPFTGFDLTLMALGGIALLGIGFGLRRAATRPTGA